jgi:hypothetical protein
VKTPGRILFCAMPRLKARFRISIKDHATGKALKVELIEQPWPGRFWIRQNGKSPRGRTDASLSMVFAQLRRWVVKRTGQVGTTTVINQR